MDAAGKYKVPNTTERAVYLVIECRLPYEEALQATRNPYSASQLYRRVKLKRAEIAKGSADFEESFLLRDASRVIDVPRGDDSAVSSLTPSPPKRKRNQAPRRASSGDTFLQPGGRASSSAAAVSSGSSSASGASGSSSRKKRRVVRLTQHQANHFRGIDNEDKEEEDTRYKAALKEGTTMYVEGKKAAKAPGAAKAKSFRTIADEMNAKHELPKERSMKKSTLAKYVKEGKVGVSPEKKGPQSCIPMAFWDLLNCHVSMKQLEGTEEVKARAQKAIIGAAIYNTEFKEMSVDYIYQEFRSRFPDTVNPTKAMEMEERRAIWTTYPNVFKWFDGSKGCLVHYGYAEDIPQRVIDMFRGHPLPCDIDENLMSELTYKYEVLRRLMNLDETQHRKASDGDSGGTRSTTLTNPELPRAGTRYSKDSGGHVSGCYGTNPLEALPPVFIFATTAKKEERMKVRPEWATGLPTVSGRWGLGEVTMMDSQVCVRLKGSMDEDLYIQTVLFYRKLYQLTLAPTFTWEGDKLISGPILIKSDGGQGRNCKSERSIKFRRDMHREGVHMMPGLPNSTAATQEMDDIFQAFKSDCDAKAQAIFGRKTFERSEAVRQSAENDDVEIKVAHLTNVDIPEIVNGRPDDPVEKRPFDHNFTPEKIFKSWLNIGLVPFTRHALQHKKVRHMLGEGGASDEMKGKLEAVQKEYGELKEKVRESGFNEGVFDASIPVHKHRSTQKTEEEQIKSLVDNKKSFSAGGQWCAMGMQLLGSTAVVKAQFLQIQKEKKGDAEQVEKNIAEQREKIDAASEALSRIEKSETLSAPDWKNILKFLLPRFEEKSAPSKFNSIDKVKTKLADLEATHGRRGIVHGTRGGGKKWMDLLKEEVDKAKAEVAAMAAVPVAAAGGQKTSGEGFSWDGLNLDGSDDDGDGLDEGDDGDVECVGETGMGSPEAI